MAATADPQSAFQLIQEVQDRLPFMSARTTHPRPSSEATEILDTDSESDLYDDFSNCSPHRSVGSLGAESMTTASSADDVKTPSSTSLTGFHFHIDENPIAGPVGPHLFRLSGASSSKQSFPEMQSTLPKSAVPSPLFNHASQEPPKDSLSEQIASKLNDEVPAEVAEWSPEDVVMWMLQLGFDESIVEKFFINDISGSILLELQSEDLKELDIQSFGKRHRLLGCIRQLRNSASLSQASDSEYPANTIERSQTETPQTNAADVGVSYNDSCITNEEKPAREAKESKRERRHRRHKRRHEVAPEDSVSI
ncbi:hypothetical protein LTS12_028932, partial [Elasticomyces elasticus]